MTLDILPVITDAVAKSYAAAYSYVYYFAVALGCVSIIAAACSRDFDRYLTDHVPHQIYRKTDTVVDPLEGVVDGQQASGPEHEPEKSGEGNGEVKV